MTTTISASIIPIFNNMFTVLDSLLVKAAERCEKTKVEESVYLNWRLAPDMLPLAAQFRFATEAPVRGAVRLAGGEIPSFADDEKSFADMRARIERAGGIINGLDTAALDADPEKDITIPVGPEFKITFPRKVLAHEFILPNLYFHTTAAYFILRHLGLDIGKRDFLPNLARYVGE